MSKNASVDVAEDAPVLFAWSAIEQYEDDPIVALDAVGLMLKAVGQALPGEIGRNVQRQIDWIATPEGTTRYPDPARLVATNLNADGAHTVLAKVGVMQQTLITRAIDAVTSGASKVALVCGGESKRRDLRARLANVAPSIVRQDPDVRPDETWTPTDDLVLPCEIKAGLREAVGFYAIMESAWRARQGQDVPASRMRLGDLYARFTEVAAQNPHANRRKVYASAEIAEVTPENPMLAFPYTKRMVSAWTVDQASALLFATVRTARELGIPEGQWIFPAAIAESNAMPALTAREDMTRPLITRLMSEAIAAATGLNLSALDLYDIYSCFPVAVKSAAEGLGLSADRALTITGGMPFAGGPYNNYVFQATCRAAELLRAGEGRTALVSCVSGLYTKQGLTVWSAAPPSQPFRALDVTDAALQRERLLPIAQSPAGPGRVAAYTVLYKEGQAGRVVAVIDLADGARTMAACVDAAVIEMFTTCEGVGEAVIVSGDSFAIAA